MRGLRLRRLGLLGLRHHGRHDGREKTPSSTARSHHHRHRHRCLLLVLLLLLLLLHHEGSGGHSPASLLKVEWELRLQLRRGEKSRRSLREELLRRLLRRGGKGQGRGVKAALLKLRGLGLRLRIRRR